MAIPFNDPDPSIQLVVTSVTSGFNDGDDPEELVEQVVVVKDDPPLSVDVEQWSTSESGSAAARSVKPSANMNNLKLCFRYRPLISLYIAFYTLKTD